MNNYKEENDSELIYLVSENNDEAKELLFKKYKPIIEIKASKYKNFVESNGYDYNDLVQEGMIGLSQAIRDFSEAKNVKFVSFANLCIDRQMSSFIRNISREKHKILNNSISIDTSTNTAGRPLIELLLDNKNINPEDSFIEMESKEELYRKIDKMLSDQERDVFYLRIQGFTYKEISLLLNITEKSVSGTIERIKIKINDILNDNK